ncbi:MAG: hypothetical protein JXR76_14635 [Deltaproteobacteria bacterium]|nr:hypothetical protein [Deltaproteobacteria bacterium]
MIKLFVPGLILFLSVVTMVSMVSMVSMAGARSDEGAQKAFEQGKELFHSGRFAEASIKFREAYQIKPNWKLFYNIGQTDAAAQKYGAALEMFERYMAYGGDNISKERSDEVIAEIERLKKIVGYIGFENFPDGAIIVVDGIPRGEAPLPGPICVTAGMEHQVQVQLNDRWLFSGKMALHSGLIRIVDLVEMKNRAEATAGPPEPSQGGALAHEGIPAQIKADFHEIKGVGWSLICVGAGALIGGGITGSVAISKHNDIKDQCKGGCPSELDDKNNTVKSLALAADVMAITGAIFAVTGALLVLVGKKKEAPLTKPLSLTPVAGKNALGVLATGEF